MKAFWNDYGKLMMAGAMCALLGMVVGVWATADMKLSITMVPKPVCRPCEPSPVPVKPCPCKPKGPGDTIEAGPCDCGQCNCINCTCPPK